MIFPFEEKLAEWWTAARGDFLGGLLLTILLGVLGVVAAIFRKTILLGIKKIFNLEPPASPPQTIAQPVQTPPPPVIVRFEGVPAPQRVNSETISPNQPVPRSAIPRPPLAGFVGRRDENGRDIVERLKEELLPEKNQLIVLWGSGGVGKTTLAGETARAMREVFVGGIVWTTADGKPDYGLSTLLDEIATQLGRTDLRQLEPEPKEEAVHQLLSTAPATLIVLDNFETISPGEQQKCANWLAARASCPALITSRDQVLQARRVRILAMSLPEAREFLQRLIGELGNPRPFENLDPEQIIQAADQVPLVLQWVVRQIDSARQPETVLDELTHGEGDAAKRVFDRSFDLPQLGDDGRATLLALSIFVPSASRPALAEVAGFANDLARLDRAVQQLVELWLTQAIAGNERLRVEGLTRELAKAHLARDENAADYRRRFVAYFRRYAEEHADPGTENYTALEAERHNLLNSFETAFELADWESVQEVAFTIAGPVDGWLSVYGYWSEALRVIQQALQAARASDEKNNIGRFGYNLALLYGHRGELEKARTLYTDSLQLFREQGDESAIGAALLQLGALADMQGDTDEAHRLGNESLEIKRKVGDQDGISNCLHHLGLIAHAQGKFEEARQLYTESLEIVEKLGKSKSISISLHQLAVLAHEQGEVQRARELYNESLQIKKKLGDQGGISTTLHELARLAYREGDFAVADQLYNESLAIKRKLGDQYGIASTLHNLGLMAEANGKLPEAAQLLREALPILESLKSPDAEITRRIIERVNSKIKDKS